MPGAISPVNAPLGSGMQVLRADADVGAAQTRSAIAASDTNGGHTTRSTAVERLQARQHLVDQRQPLGDGRVHLPVAGDDRLAVPSAVASQRRHARQHLAFDELERRAAAGRDVAELVGHARLLDGLDRLAAADDRGSRRVRQRVRDARACRRQSAGPRRCPSGRSRARCRRCRISRRVGGDGLRADVGDDARRRPTSPMRRAWSRRRSRLQVGGHDHVALAAGSCRRARSRSRRRSAPGRLRAGSCRPPARAPSGTCWPCRRRSAGDRRDRSGSPARPAWRRLWRRRRSATNGRFGFSSAPPRETISFSISRPATAGSRCATPSVEACARWAVPKASLTKTSPSLASSAGEVRVVGFLFGVKAHVLEQHHVTRAKRARPRPAPAGRRSRVAKPDRARRAARPGAAATGCSEYLGSTLPSGRPRCDSSTTRAPCSAQVFEGRQRGADARVVGDRAVLHRAR